MMTARTSTRSRRISEKRHYCDDESRGISLSRVLADCVAGARVATATAAAVCSDAETAAENIAVVSARALKSTVSGAEGDQSGIARERRGSRPGTAPIFAAVGSGGGRVGQAAASPIIVADRDGNGDVCSVSVNDVCLSRRRSIMPQSIANIVSDVVATNEFPNRGSGDDEEIGDEDGEDECDVAHCNLGRTVSKRDERLRLIEKLGDRKKESTNSLDGLKKTFNELETDEKDSLRSCFELCDKDSDGLLTVGEACACLIELGLGGSTAVERDKIVQICKDVAQNSVHAKLPQWQIEGNLTGDDEDSRATTARCRTSSDASSLHMPRPTDAESRSSCVAQSGMGTAKFRAALATVVSMKSLQPNQSGSGMLKFRALASAVRPASIAPGIANTTLNMNIWEFSIQVVPAVRRAITDRFCEALRQVLADRNVANAATAELSMEDWSVLVWRLGIDQRSYIKAASCLSRHSASKRWLESPPSLSVFIAPARLDPFRLCSGRKFSLQVAASIAAGCKERVERSQRADEREIWLEERIADNLFYDMRDLLIDLHDRYELFCQPNTGTICSEAALSIMKEFGFLPTERCRIKRMSSFAWLSEDPQAVDQAQEDRFTFSSFLKFCSRCRNFTILQNQREVGKLFGIYSKGGGVVTMAQASQILGQLGLAPRSREEQLRIERFLLDGSMMGTTCINSDGFQMIFARIVEYYSRSAWELWVDRALDLGFSEDDLHEFWRAFETEDWASCSSGRLSLQQVKNALTALRREASPEVLTAAMSGVPVIEDASGESGLDGGGSGDDIAVVWLDFSGFLALVEKVPSEDDSCPSVASTKLGRLIRRKDFDEWTRPRMLRRALRWMRLPHDYIQIVPSSSLFQVWSEYFGLDVYEDGVPASLCLGNRSLPELMKGTRAIGETMGQAAVEFDGHTCVAALAEAFRRLSFDFCAR
eukprot:TRINITY_DN18850_c0_g2_i1.p1 TRINITY_DN18850_c0_g2~~TRINITY_DN18850_c0_g2_i1.p1  ORF type:complete len:998 (+),score=172.40 TRINITY_DN18850_c0_g2_i1:182-2995(+)